MWTLLDTFWQTITENSSQVKNAWETLLTQSWIVPQIHTRWSLPSNQRFGFYDAHGHLVEWKLPSVTLMRAHWQKNFHPSLQPEFQKLVTSLPGAKQTCRQCQWEVPVMDMWNSHTCNTCQLMKKQTLTHVKPLTTNITPPTPNHLLAVPPKRTLVYDIFGPRHGRLLSRLRHST